jgi:hypothetical protein
MSRLVQEGVVDNRVLEILIPDGEPIRDEDVYWDYKERLPCLPASRPPSKQEKLIHDVAISEVIKDVVSFHNSNGGYLLVGIKDHLREIVGFSLSFDCDDLCKRLFGYTRRSIECKFRLLKVDKLSPTKTVGILYIPRRDDDDDPVQFAKGGPSTENGHRAFNANDIYFRNRDECRPAISAEDLAFLFHRGRRVHGSSPALSASTFIENNLPDRDPNLIAFVGRETYLDGLWQWFWTYPGFVER